MSTATAMRIGRTYTRARRHPWVMGKIGDWTLPLGPYTPAQLTIAGVGIFVLIKTFSWWAPLGPAPVLGLGVAVWLARASRMGGRSPLWVAYGWGQRALQPAGGRMNGRAVRPARPRALYGSFLIETTSGPAAAEPAAPPRTRPRTAPSPAPTAGPGTTRPPRRRMWQRTARPGTAMPVARPAPTPLQQLLREQQEGQR
ncbi:hypothetical protein [Streptomyces flavofungini]|uniref:hypothetical protein n=1 Tax=Streptomyces flavofungini TaxID=68200 RepID=UPI0025AF5C26|nr:hypothetical protein [Streptomyces flavofungini]WJV51806.1 hypothetical protein QUY26_39980 [Streptomyces flavofungini]